MLNLGSNLVLVLVLGLSSGSKQYNHTRHESTRCNAHTKYVGCMNDALWELMEHDNMRSSKILQNMITIGYYEST